MNAKRGFVGLALAALLLVAADDKKDKDKNPDCYLVSGSVTFKGKPLAGAVIVLHPQAAGAAFKARGETDEEGQYKLTTFKAGDGAPAGKYRVTITVPERDDKGKIKAGTDRLKGAFGNPKTATLTVEIQAANGGNSYNVDLK